MRPLYKLALTAALVGCASGGGPHGPQENPAIVAAVSADLRMVGSETTWVAHGQGYQLVALTKRDIAAVDSSVEHQSQMYTLVFGVAPQNVAVTVTHVWPSRNAAPTRSAPPLPPGLNDPIVELSLGATTASGGQSRNEGYGGGAYGGGYGGGGGGGTGIGSGDYGGSPSSYGPSGPRDEFEAPGTPPIDPAEAVMRAWLSARATKLMAQPATRGANGLAEDPRVPAWAEILVPALVAKDTTIKRLAVELAAQPDGPYALRDFFTMPMPAFYTSPANRGGANTARGDRMGGGMRGGRGRQSGGTTSGAQSTLMGGALFVAQATVLGKYLALRQGPPLIAQLMDGQIHGKRVADILASQTTAPKDLEALDADWRSWLSQYASGQQ